MPNRAVVKIQGKQQQKDAPLATKKTPAKPDDTASEIIQRPELPDFINMIRGQHKLPELTLEKVPPASTSDSPDELPPPVDSLFADTLSEQELLVLREQSQNVQKKQLADACRELLNSRDITRSLSPEMRFLNFMLSPPPSGKNKEKFDQCYDEDISEDELTSEQQDLYETLLSKPLDELIKFEQWYAAIAAAPIEDEGNDILAEAEKKLSIVREVLADVRHINTLPEASISKINASRERRGMVAYHYAGRSIASKREVLASYLDESRVSMKKLYEGLAEYEFITKEDTFDSFARAFNGVGTITWASKKKGTLSYLIKNLRVTRKRKLWKTAEKTFVILGGSTKNLQQAAKDAGYEDMEKIDTILENSRPR